MSFKERYKEELNAHQPASESVERLLEQAQSVESKQQVRKMPWYRSRAFIGLTSAAAVLVVAYVSVALLSRPVTPTAPLSTIAKGPAYAGLNLIQATAGYDNLYKLFAEQKKRSNDTQLYGYRAGMESSKSGSTAMDSTGLGTGPMPNQTSPILDFSQTNIQVQGVQEADIVKTDGEYIYTVSEQYINILEANNGKPKVISRIKRTTTKKGYFDTGVFEIYVTENRLMLLTHIAKEQKVGDGGVAPMELKRGATVDPASNIAVDIMPYMMMGDATVIVYDTTDKSDPKKLKTITQSGSYISSRMIGDTLFMVSNYGVYDFHVLAKDKPETYVPVLSEDASSSPVEPDDIVICPDVADTQYTVISSIDTSGTPELSSSKSMLGFGSTMYASLNNLYITSYKQIERPGKKADRKIVSDGTNIVRVSLADGKVEIEATGQVEGTVLNQFSIDEYENNLRVVTTSNVMEVITGGKDGDIWVSSTEPNSSSAGLYVLNRDLDVIGSIEDVAKGEQVYSVRLMEDVGYFVTFRQVDPLFSVNLSNPANPKIVGKLKIPGFSNYLHPYAPNRLFGLGSDADEKTGQVGSLKLSMFDTTDPTQLTERHSFVISGKSYSEASYNHRAILIDANKSIIAFPADDKYLVYRYKDKTGFSKKAEIGFGGTEFEQYAYNLRGLYIGDVLYVVSPISIASYDMDNYDVKKITKLK